MEEIKASKLTTTFDKYAGRQVKLNVEYKDLTIQIEGKLQKNDKEYWLTHDNGKVVLERQTAGSLMSFRGTYKVLLVQCMVGETMLAKFEIPTKGKFFYQLLD